MNFFSWKLGGSKLAFNHVLLLALCYPYLQRVSQLYHYSPLWITVQIYLPISGIICIVYPSFLSWKSVIFLTHQDRPTWKLTLKLARHDRTEAASGKVCQWPHLCGFALRSFWGIFLFWCCIWYEMTFAFSFLLLRLMPLGLCPEWMGHGLLGQYFL